MSGAKFGYATGVSPDEWPNTVDRDELASLFNQATFWLDHGEVLFSDPGSLAASYPQGDALTEAALLVVRQAAGRWYSGWAMEMAEQQEQISELEASLREGEP